MEIDMCMPTLRANNCIQVQVVSLANASEKAHGPWPAEARTEAC